jgi:hypothetical protein
MQPQPVALYALIQGGDTRDFFKKHDPWKVAKRNRIQKQYLLIKVGAIKFHISREENCHPQTGGT